MIPENYPFRLEIKVKKYETRKERNKSQQIRLGVISKKNLVHLKTLSKLRLNPSLPPYFWQIYCQAQFQLASQVTSWTEISLKFDYYHPPTRESRDADWNWPYIWSVGSWWIVCLVIFGGRGGLWGWSESNLVALHRRDPSHLDNIINSKFWSSM